MIVSVTANAGEAGVARAVAIALQHGGRFVPRRALGDEDALLVGRNELMLRAAGRVVRWHPGMLHTLRQAGWGHPIVKAAGLRVGDRVADLTVGFGTMATFLAELTGQPVVGWERSPAIALVAAPNLPLVEVNIGDGPEWLAAQAPGAFDVVLIDPLFSTPGVGGGLTGVRAMGCGWQPDRVFIARAQAVAARAVVVRGPRETLVALGCATISGRPDRPACTGTWPGCGLTDPA